MTVWIVDSTGRAHVAKTRARSVQGAYFALLDMIREPIEIRESFAERAPLEVIIGRLAATCREVVAWN